MVKRNKKPATKSVVNVRSVVKENTDLNLGADALSELVDFTENSFLPIMIRHLEKVATDNGKKTIQERECTIVEDWVTSAMKSYGLI